jgi:hypothetical protein
MTRLVAILTLALFAQATKNKPVESAHVAGPNGLEGWTESVILEEVAKQGPLPTVLIIARNGKIVRRIDGEPFVWNFRFQPDGRHVAFETGPLHFSMTCVLENIRTGRRVDSVDCWRDLPPNAPAWAKDLEKQRIPQDGVSH